MELDHRAEVKEAHASSTVCQAIRTGQGWKQESEGVEGGGGGGCSLPRRVLCTWWTRPHLLKGQVVNADSFESKLKGDTGVRDSHSGRLAARDRPDLTS